MSTPSSRSASPARPPSPSQLYPPNRLLPLPEGTHTLLPLIEACDNLVLPTGPWEADDCRRRWEGQKGRERKREVMMSAVEGSALDDDDDEEEEEPKSAEDEFLVPFFVDLPFLNTSTAPPASLSRRSSSSASASARPTFSPLTPLSNSAAPEVADKEKSGKEKAQPIGFLRPEIVKGLVEDQRKMIAMNCTPPWSFLPPLSFAPPTRRSSRSYSRRGSNAGTPSAATPGTPGESNPPSRRGSSVAPNLKGRGELEQALEGLAMNGGGGEQWKQVYAVGFAERVNGEGREARREQVDRVVRGWKAQGMFKEVLGGWRDEEYDIYGPPSPTPPSAATNNHSNSIPPSPRSNVVFSMERSACALFGVATFGVHMTAYIEEEGQPLKFWVPRRSATKQTWPSYLDNTVAGGISAGSTPYSTILREAIEEASLPPAFVASRIHGSSVLVYNYRTADGWLQPEVQYVYDLRMDAGEGAVRPGVNDGEVQEFMLMELDEVVERMVKGEFKPNCAIVLLDFFLRHGYLTPESDSRFLEVAMRLRRTLALPGPA